MGRVSGKCGKKPIAQAYQNGTLLEFWYVQNRSREGPRFRFESGEPNWNFRCNATAKINGLYSIAWIRWLLCGLHGNFCCRVGE